MTRPEKSKLIPIHIYYFSIIWGRGLYFFLVNIHTLFAFFFEFFSNAEIESYLHIAQHTSERRKRRQRKRERSKRGCKSAVIRHADSHSISSSRWHVPVRSGDSRFSGGKVCHISEQVVIRQRTACEGVARYPGSDPVDSLPSPSSLVS